MGCMGCMEDIKYDEGMRLSCVMKPKKFLSCKTRIRKLFSPPASLPPMLPLPNPKKKEGETLFLMVSPFGPYGKHMVTQTRAGRVFKEVKVMGHPGIVRRMKVT